MKQPWHLNPPIVIMGRGHSGTRILTWLCARLGVQLGEHPERKTGDVDDLKFSRRIKKIAIKASGTDWTSAEMASGPRSLEAAARKYFRNLGSPTGRWGWKFPETYLIGPLVERVFPEAVYIHLVRDGRDIAFKQHLTDDPTRKLGRKLLQYLNALEEPHHVQAARSWQHQVEQFRIFKATIPSERMLEMRYEDLCTKPREEGARLCAFLNLPMTDEAADYLATGIRSDKVAQYLENRPEHIAEVEARVGGLLSELGYR